MYKHTHKKDIENVLILQGGDSLGAFACGVCKTFAKKGIKFNIIAGTSIGSINGAIMTGSKNDNPAKDLEDFWIEIAESNHNIIPDMFSYEYDNQNYEFELKRSSSEKLSIKSSEHFYRFNFLDWAGFARSVRQTIESVMLYVVIEDIFSFI